MSGWQPAAAKTADQFDEWITCASNPPACTSLSIWDMAIPGGDPLTGTFPTTIGLFTNLQEIKVSSTIGGFTGALPTEIGLLTAMGTGTVRTGSGGPFYKGIDLLIPGTAKLTGNLPTELGLLTSMKYLSMHSQGFTGPLPSQLGALTDLTTLWLYSNQLTGTIPSEYAQFTSMPEVDPVLGYGAMDLSDNQLSGPIPAEFANFGRLVLCTNAGLCGNVPTGMNFVEAEVCDNDGFDGTNIGQACPTTPPTTSPTTTSPTTTGPEKCCSLFVDNIAFCCIAKTMGQDIYGPNKLCIHTC